MRIFLETPIKETFLGETYKCVYGSRVTTTIHEKDYGRDVWRYRTEIYTGPVCWVYDYDYTEKEAKNTHYREVRRARKAMRSRLKKRVLKKYAKRKENE